ncbi:MAG: SMI1/KNR4 family protein [Lachnospiraceae bacterium]|nr:SMI1/KNR4 family protein [Lachnospiraceae bacterium]
MNYDINMILPFQKENCKENSWEEVEKRIGIIFPEDYKEFIDSYGEGSINEFFMDIATIL